MNVQIWETFLIAVIVRLSLLNQKQSVGLGKAQNIYSCTYYVPDIFVAVLWVYFFESSENPAVFGMHYTDDVCITLITFA